MKRLPRFIALAALVLGIAHAAEPDAPDPRTADEYVQAQMELTQLEFAVASLKLPMSYAAVVSRLGGETVLRHSSWSDTSFKEHRQSVHVFAVVSEHLKDKGYIVVIEEVGTNGPISRAAVGYRHPLGGVYFADLTKVRWFVSEAKPEANQPPQRNAGSRPSSMNSTESETPSSSGPRG